MRFYNYLGSEFASAIANVTDYGAKGDGVSSDSVAIQSALDALKDTGGIIFFPSGTYLITVGLIFYSNQTLIFENGATLLRGADINNLLMSHCGSDTTEYNGTHDCVIYGAIFDGGTYQSNITLLGLVHSKNIIIENCKFKNAYGLWHDFEINSSYNIKVSNCDFEGSSKTGSNGCMIQVDAIDTQGTWPWSGNRGEVDGTVSKYVSISGCIFHDDIVSPAIGNHSDTTSGYVKIYDNIFVGLTSTRGAINGNLDNVDVCGNIFEGCTKGIGSGGSTYYITDNRFVDVTTASAQSSNVHNNMINGVYTA